MRSALASLERQPSTSVVFPFAFPYTSFAFLEVLVLFKMINLKVSKSSSIVASAILVGVASFLLFSRLGTPYLWQDEAATAVLAQRMLRFGRPLSYDGMNLITIDHFAAEDSNTIDQRTRDPQAAVQFYVRRGDYKPDTTWKWQPWGQFVIAALSLKILGASTLAARVPFALAGMLTILLLYWLVWDHLKSSRLALLACSFLVFNAYWIVHSRQCRYYSLSSLFLMLTITSYARWQWGNRWGAVGFVISAWCWFQVDYGTVWPVLGVLFADAFIAQRRSLWRPAVVGVVLAAAIAPFADYHELWGRLSIRAGTWHERFVRNATTSTSSFCPTFSSPSRSLWWLTARRTCPHWSGGLSPFLAPFSLCFSSGFPASRLPPSCAIPLSWLQSVLCWQPGFWCAWEIFGHQRRPGQAR